ncbi:MAG: S8 family serine peptidase [Nitrosopumilaceae archaeon]
MPKTAIFSIFVLLSSVLLSTAYGFYDVDLMQPKPSFDSMQKSNIIHFSTPNTETPQVKRYLVFGNGPVSAVKEVSNSIIYDMVSQNGFFAVGTFSQNIASDLQSRGYSVIEDFPLEFDFRHSPQEVTEVSRIGEITGSDKVFQKYNLSGNGIVIGIVDTGTDFSNPDIQDSLARDEDNKPIMFDADGQGLVLTNSTFVANIDKRGILKNYTNQIPENMTSSVYVTSNGVFLDIVQKGNNTSLMVNNPFHPLIGPPLLNGTISDDMKIGKDHKDYIVSKSGIYHLGIIFQGIIQGNIGREQIVPVLVIDSEESGYYDTIIPDMSTSWIDFTRFELDSDEEPDYDFDFTDETPITLGDGNEFLLYDSDKDGKNDYSVGTVGAHVLDVFGIIYNKSATEKGIGAINGTILQPMDPEGNYFGIMTDMVGHGTGTAATITSKGTQEYDIYNSTKKYFIKGVAPGAKIVPIKALWFGDTLFAWLWAAGFDFEEENWKFNGKPRVDILSNSWGVSNFPNLQSAPGLDILSLIMSTLMVPGSIDKDYPGVLMVSSAGNSGHGYGTLGLPSASPYSISVGATTNNVFVGYGPFKEQPRFGNTTIHSNEVVDFSSRGPSIIGDPKPDLMSIGAYSFTPKSITKMNKNATDPFGLFGGTSMSAPLVAGSAAILMESLNEESQEYDPLRIKNILMSTATDLENDPFTQGSGLVNVEKAVDFVKGNEGTFIVYNDASYSNIKKILDVRINAVNSSSFGIEKFQLNDEPLSLTSWFGGRLFPGERTTTTFTIENPTNSTIQVKIKPEKLELIKRTQFNGTTNVLLQDPILNKTDVFRPNYVHLEDIKQFENLASFYDEPEQIPDDASLMILNVNFPFSTFMNKTDDLYANDLRISSLYLYDWHDKNNKTEITSDELSLINRGGSWGTVQEIRVSDPNSKFENTPVVGIYPVPKKYSYWFGDIQKNATSMNYILTASYYNKGTWDTIWIDKRSVEVPPNATSDVIATIVVPLNSLPSVYQGFIKFEGDTHSVNVPVTYAVKKEVKTKDTITVITGSQEEDVLYGPGFINGAFDMVNRYNAGDWRQYYFDIQDSTINAASIDISWEDEDTNFSVFFIDPQGRIVQTNVPAGVLGHFSNWPTGDWLGTTSFSQGGGFYPIKNKDKTSTVMFAPINQTGTYTLLMHSTLFGGNELAEPFDVATKFSTILPDETIPQILLDLPKFVSSMFNIEPEIIEKNVDVIKFYLDGNEFEPTDTTEFSIPQDLLTDDSHTLKIFVSDTVGHTTTEEFSFIVDNLPPAIILKSPINGSTISGTITVDLKITEQNLAESDGIIVTLPNGDIISDETSIKFDTKTVEDGSYDIKVLANDKAGNKKSEFITVNIDNTTVSVLETKTSDQDNLLTIGIIVGITIGVILIVLVTKKVRILRKNRNKVYMQFFDNDS